MHSDDEILPTPDKSNAPIFSDGYNTLSPTNKDCNKDMMDLLPIYPSIRNNNNPADTKSPKYIPYTDIVSEIIANAITKELHYKNTSRGYIIVTEYNAFLSKFGIDNVYKNKGLNIILHAATKNKCTTILELETCSGLLSEQLIRYAKSKDINNLDIQAAASKWRLHEKLHKIAYMGKNGIQPLDMAQAVKSYDAKWRAQECIFLMLQFYLDFDNHMPKLLDNLLELLNSSYKDIKIIFCIYTTGGNYKLNSYLAQFKKFTKSNFTRSVYSNTIFGDYVFMGGVDGFVNTKLIVFTREANATATIKKSMCSIS